MFFFNILAFGVATVSARAIGGSACKLLSFLCVLRLPSSYFELL